MPVKFKHVCLRNPGKRQEEIHNKTGSLKMAGLIKQNGRHYKDKNNNNE